MSDFDWIDQANRPQEFSGGGQVSEVALLDEPEAKDTTSSSARSAARQRAEANAKRDKKAGIERSNEAPLDTRSSAEYNADRRSAKRDAVDPEEAQKKIEQFEAAQAALQEPSAETFSVAKADDGTDAKPDVEYVTAGEVQAMIDSAVDRILNLIGNEDAFEEP